MLHVSVGSVREAAGMDEAIVSRITINSETAAHLALPSGR